MSQDSTRADLENFKTKIIDSTILFGSVIGFIAFILAYLPQISELPSIGFFINSSLFSLLFTIFFLRNRLSSEVKSLAILAIILGFVISDTFLWGVFSFNTTVIVLIPFYAFLVFGFRKALIIYFVALLAYLSVGILQYLDVISIKPDLESQFHNFFSWFEHVVVISVVGIIIIVFIKNYYSAISNLIEDLENKNKILAEREETLGIEQTFTSGLLDSLPGLFNLFKKNKNGFELVRWNKNTLKISGLTDDELLGQDPFYIIHPDHKDTIHKVVENISLGKSDGQNAKSWNFKNSEKSEWFYFTGRPISYNNEDYFIGLGIDITEQKSVENSFHQEKAFSDTILDIIPGMFYLYKKEADNFYLHKWNKNHETITGYSADELKGMKPLDFFSPEHHEVISSTTSLLGKKEVVTFEAPIVKKDGTGDFWYFTTQKVKDENNEYLIGVGLDIADRKVMERELEHRNFNLKDMLDDMQLRNNKLAEYAFINSHLLRAPLVRILGLAELVSKEVIFSEHQELLENFRTSAEELDAIVSKINETLDQRRDLNREDILEALSQLSEKKQPKKKV